MQNRSPLTLAKVLFYIILANFLAQIPYFFHLYYGKQNWLISARSFVVMGAVFAFFLVGSVALFRRQRLGYPLMLVFLTVEFLFYLYGLISSIVHGLGPFFQIHNPDLWLRVIYSIGYLNLFASGGFLYLLLRHRSAFQPPARINKTEITSNP